MLDLEYIKKTSLWVARFTTGARITGTYDEVKQYQSQDDCKDVDILSWKGQPKDLQEFYKAYEYATFYMNRGDLLYIDDFYKEWAKNPEQFKPGMRPVIDKLSAVFERLSSCSKNTDILITNYDKRGIGNHTFDNWTKALSILDTDYDVVAIEEDTNPIKIVIQTDEDSATEFSQKSNSVALEEAFK